MLEEGEEKKVERRLYNGREVPLYCSCCLKKAVSLPVWLAASVSAALANCEYSIQLELLC